MFSFLTAPILKYLSSGLAVALLLLGAHDMRVNHLRSTYKAQRDQVREEYGLFKIAIVDKTAEALAAQKAVNAKQKEQFNAAASQADAQIGDLRSDLRAARLRAQAGGSTGRGAGTASQGNAAPLPEGLPAASGGVQEQMCMTGDIADGLAAYAIQSHNLAKDMISRGVAEWAPVD